MSGASSWRPTRPRLHDTLLAALAPVTACSVALGALTTWVSTGNAGSPPEISVTDGRVWLSFGDTPETSAYFRMTNSGGADDRLVRVTTTAVRGGTTLTGHRMVTENTATDQEIDSIAVPSGVTVAMAPGRFNVTLRADKGWEEGDLVPFTLHFEHEGAVDALAVVGPPSAGES
ncbi:copper chaperone PCu(A)C [Streptomyces sp. NPDC048002]|uniref:copper chaperone PCu(A)C n=1 Tax=Streptomyces sp. NPDC048002 TaxID=3154344 RepID=UPI0033E9BDCC